MEAQTNNPAVIEPASVQEPASGLDNAEEIAVEGTGTVEEQSATNSNTEAKQVKVDLNKAIAKLSPEEQKAYKAFQAEYTKNQQTLSEHEKRNTEYEAYLNGIVSDPEISAILRARQEKAKEEKAPDFSKMSDEEIFNYQVDKRVQEKMTELESKIEAKYGSFIQNKLVSEGNKIMEDFAEAKKIPVEDVTELAKYAIDHKVTLEEAYKVAYFDKIPVQAKQEALEDLESKKNANLELGTIPSGLTPVMPTKPTFAEAAKLAEKSTGLSWAKVKTE